MSVEEYNVQTPLARFVQHIHQILGVHSLIAGSGSGGIVKRQVGHNKNRLFAYLLGSQPLLQRLCGGFGNAFGVFQKRVVGVIIVIDAEHPELLPIIPAGLVQKTALSVVLQAVLVVAGNAKLLRRGGQTPCQQRIIQVLIPRFGVGSVIAPVGVVPTKQQGIDLAMRGGNLRHQVAYNRGAVLAGIVHIVATACRKGVPFGLKVRRGKNGKYLILLHGGGDRHHNRDHHQQTENRCKNLFHIPSTLSFW